MRSHEALGHTLLSFPSLRLTNSQHPITHPGQVAQPETAEPSAVWLKVHFPTSLCNIFKKSTRQCSTPPIVPSQQRRRRLC